MDHWDIHCRTNGPQDSIEVGAFHMREDCESSTSGVVRASGTDITVISPSSSPSSSPGIAQTVSSYKYT